MRCCDCPYYSEGQTDYEYYNECKLTGDMYFLTYDNCPHLKKELGE